MFCFLIFEIRTLCYIISKRPFLAALIILKATAKQREKYETHGEYVCT